MARFELRIASQMTRGERCAPYLEGDRYLAEQACDRLNNGGGGYAWKSWDGKSVSGRYDAGYAVVDLEDGWHKANTPIDDSVLVQKYAEMQRSECGLSSIGVGQFQTASIADLKAAWSRELRKRVEASDKARKEANIVYGPIDDWD